MLGLLRLPLVVLRTLLAWSPVWISAILIWQFTTRGLRPAQAESQRLRHLAPEVEGRHDARKADFEVMAAESEAWDDPVFRERQRRLRAAARGEDPVPRVIGATPAAR